MRLGAVFATPALLSFFAACTASVDPAQRDAGASGPCEGVTCNDGFVCLDGACVPEDPCDGVRCDGADEECRGGRCVSCESDRDGDSFEACVDCDDDDPDVVPGSEAPCESACGLGTVRCLGLAGWSTCNAPLECSCTAGETRTEPCGRCGTLLRTCGDGGLWGDPGECQEAGECVPGTVSTEACGDDCTERERQCTPGCTWGDWSECAAQGACTAGSIETTACPDGGQKTRTCGADCAWSDWTDCGAEAECTPGEQGTEACGNCGTKARTCGGDGVWGPWGACGGEGACTPGESEDGDCGNCGARTRTCGADCQWSAWGACGGEGACAPGDTRDGDCDPCSQQVCGAQCGWDTCSLRPGSECEWEQGTNWQCCGAGRWQFCLPNSCQWSDQCADCTGCGC